MNILTMIFLWEKGRGLEILWIHLWCHRECQFDGAFRTLGTVGTNTGDCDDDGPVGQLTSRCPVGPASSRGEGGSCDPHRSPLIG